MGKMLTVNNLTKSFGDVTAANDISFSVNKGEIMGFLGPNGAGKTTVFRIIMGIIRADYGEISFYFNNKPEGLNKQKIGYLPEEKGLYEDVKVIDNLIYIANLKGLSRKEAKKAGLEWLERLDLKDYSKQKLEKLSRGMNQKVQFIAAIIHKPDFVVLDEPFAGLDPVNQEFVIEIVRELQEEGLTILFSAHQMNMVEELCDSIFMINQGEQVLQGNLKDIKNSYQEYNVEINFRDESDSTFLKKIKGIDINKQGPGYVKCIYNGNLDINELVNQLTDNLQLEEIKVETPPLHDIFINTVKKRGGKIETV